MPCCGCDKIGGAGLSLVLGVSIALSPCVRAAGRSGVQAAVGWSDTQNHVEQLNLETLTLQSSAEAGLVPPNAFNNGGASNLAFRPPVNPTFHSSLAVAFWTVGLIAGTQCLLRLWHEPDPRGQDPGPICDRLSALFCLSLVASVALGLGSFFVLLAAGVTV